MVRRRRRRKKGAIIGTTELTTLHKVCDESKSKDSKFFQTTSLQFLRNGYWLYEGNNLVMIITNGLAIINCNMDLNLYCDGLVLCEEVLESSTQIIIDSHYFVLLLSLFFTLIVASHPHYTSFKAFQVPT